MDIEPSLDDLFAEFSDLQEDEEEKIEKIRSGQSNLFLSHNSVVDLMSFLISMKKFEKKNIKIYFTSDGNYLTRKRIAEEINNTIRSEDITSISKLSQKIGVDNSIIENVLLSCFKISKESKLHNKSVEIKEENQIIFSEDTIFLYNNKVCNYSYIDSIILEIKDILVENGVLKVTEICNRFKFNVNFFTNIVSPRLFPDKKAQKDLPSTEKIFKVKNIIYTHKYITMAEHMIAGYFSGINEPTTIDSFENLFVLPEQICVQILRKLIAIKRIEGKLVTSGSSFLFFPKSFEIQTKKNILEFLKANDLLDFKYIENEFIWFQRKKDLKKFLIKNFSREFKLTFFENCVVTESFYEKLFNHVQDAVMNANVLDLFDIPNLDLFEDDEIEAIFSHDIFSQKVDIEDESDELNQKKTQPYTKRSKRRKKEELQKKFYVIENFVFTKTYLAKYIIPKLKKRIKKKIKFLKKNELPVTNIISSSTIFKLMNIKDERKSKKEKKKTKKTKKRKKKEEEEKKR